jgi:hypothetical protein
VAETRSALGGRPSYQGQQEKNNRQTFIRACYPAGRQGYATDLTAACGVGTKVVLFRIPSDAESTADAELIQEEASMVQQ